MSLKERDRLSIFSQVRAGQVTRFVGNRDDNDDLNINLAGLASFHVGSDDLFDGDEPHLAVVFDHQAMEIRVFVDETLIHTRATRCLPPGPGRLAERPVPPWAGPWERRTARAATAKAAHAQASPGLMQTTLCLCNPRIW